MSERHAAAVHVLTFLVLDGNIKGRKGREEKERRR